jgi:hypothetical protein
VPLPPEADGISVENIVDAVQCELAGIYERPHGIELRDWAARVTLNLKVVNDAMAAPTLTVTPTISSGTLTVPIGPDLEDQSTRVTEIVFDVHMHDLEPNSKNARKLPNCPSYTGLPQAAYGLGVTDWLATVAAAAGRHELAALEGARSVSPGNDRVG